MDGGCPKRMTSPRLGASRPSSILISVVLPAPLAPSRPTTSRGATCRSTSRTAAKWPNMRVAPVLCASNSVMRATRQRVRAPARRRSLRPADRVSPSRSGIPSAPLRSALPMSFAAPEIALAGSPCLGSPCLGSRSWLGWPCLGGRWLGSRWLGSRRPRRCQVGSTPAMLARAARPALQPHRAAVLARF